MDENKTELFRIFSEEISKLSGGKILSAYDGTTKFTDHEEADTRVFLHVNDMSRKGITNVMIRTVDTDVFLLAISLYDHLNLDQLWIDFGSGKQRCYLSIHEMVMDPVKQNRFHRL